LKQRTEQILDQSIEQQKEQNDFLTACHDCRRRSLGKNRMQDLREKEISRKAYIIIRK